MLYVVDEPEPTIKVLAGDVTVAPAGRAAPRVRAAAPAAVAPRVATRRRREVGLLAIVFAPLFLLPGRFGLSPLDVQAIRTHDATRKSRDGE
jgi:hypothetical protein